MQPLMMSSFHFTGSSFWISPPFHLMLSDVPIVVFLVMPKMVFMHLLWKVSIFLIVSSEVINFQIHIIAQRAHTFDILYTWWLLLSFCPVGREIAPEDRTPLSVGNEEIEAVNEFPYLGSVVSSTGQMDIDVSRRIAQASRAFGCLRKPVFMASPLSFGCWV